MERLIRAGVGHRVSMERNDVVETIARGRIVAILSSEFGGREEEIAVTLFDAGVTAIEVTLNSPGALCSISALADRFGSRMAVGAGTILRTKDVERIADAGARFIVSPNLDFCVIEVTRRRNLVSNPGLSIAKTSSPSIFISLQSWAESLLL